ncbi:circularly permuted type 2 ATP-grasp protein [Sphingomonas aerophila]|uniref:Putative circularly permuted ATP-grasp superfamily protein/putative alpha-E superfamily protein n=1 Tax=Sphingomonas aerophila TaxID=1344948 RepID=A0A7W9B9V2_9SPHN|nr:circularly permuted type 2 ATP-grasp protein [Sphingomonas aerophila]MBB5713247.1 putative circularly permuted ATP-grasp superfamily protein/putative alpha-E superfamily protein [Sphingomonas aerophila]
MATHPAAPLFEATEQARRWMADYRAGAGWGDVLASGDDDAWSAMFEELGAVAGRDLGHARERVRRHTADIGTGFRLADEAEERPWPLSPVPLLIGADEWRHIERGVIQRADLLERVTADLYGPARLVADGDLPASVVTGSPHFVRTVAGLEPPGGRHLHMVGMDLARGPGGEWRVLADHLRAPAGAGYALENRLAIGRTLGGLGPRLNVQRHAPFFAAFRDGVTGLCRRAEPRIGLLTPGRYSPSYAEQAHLARYLGFLLVEGADLAALDGRLYIRTVAGLKRIDAVWRRIDTSLLDPLAFDTHSQIGVPGLLDAYAAGNLVISNPPGAGLLEACAFHAFFPRLASRLLGEELLLPSIATWWCGSAREAAHVTQSLDGLMIAPAFGVAPLGLPAGAPVAGADLSGDERAVLLEDMARRPQDYVGQEVVRLSTMPVVIGDTLVPRPFTLRVFATRDAHGDWTVMPGGFARIGDEPDARAAIMGEGTWSADVAVHGAEPVAPVSLLSGADSHQVRRNPGTLPSRVADNFFWLGRYLERGEALLAAIRVLLGNSIDADGGGALAPDTVGRLVGLIAGSGAAAYPASLDRAALTAFARLAMEDEHQHSVRVINGMARIIGDGSRDRLSADMIRLLDAPFPSTPGLLDRAGALQRRYVAIAGLSAEHMGRTDAWRFHDLGRRIERATAITRAVRLFGMKGASRDDLSTLLDLADSQISYRQRYLTGIARVPVVDLVALDPGNPRALAFQIERVAVHLGKLPVLEDDGMAEPQQACGIALQAAINTATAAGLDPDTLGSIERRLSQLSDAIARRYFLQGAEPLRAAGLTLA